MTSKEELRKQFVVGSDIIRNRIEDLVQKALQFCVITENGTVHMNIKGLGAKNQVKLVLAARSLAAELDTGITAETGFDDLVASTGLPPNQLRARMTDVINEHFASSPRKGVYVANPHKIEAFLDALKK
jgi:hypothetical protein